MSTKRYPTDTTNDQWEILRPLIPLQEGRGRPRKVDLRRIVDGIFYVSRSGCQWRMLPHDFPPWETVYYYFNKWKKDGTLARIHDSLNEAVRQQDKPTPRTTASVDSQTTDSHGAQEARAYDGGKKMDGRKRHLVVDSLGLILAVIVTAGDVLDGVGGAACLEELDPDSNPDIETIYADTAYGKVGFPEFVAEWKPGCEVVVIGRPKDAEGFVKLPIRWVVERTNAWLTKNRRLCRSYEHTTLSEVSFIHIVMIHRNVRRLSGSHAQSPFRFKMMQKLAA
jgi:putative transposase